MKIGITERGDASRDFSWENRLKEVDGVILITKFITDEFINRVLKWYKIKPIIVHCTCTGWGGTKFEPQVPHYGIQLIQLSKLINSGFPAENCVLRVDPIFPTPKGINVARNVLIEYENTIKPLGVTRVRVSILDEYRHVKSRFHQAGIPPVYGSYFGPNELMRASVAQLMLEFPEVIFETCAEDDLVSLTKNALPLGCVSSKDLRIMKLPLDTFLENPQRRHGCHCLSCKTELLSNRHRCENGCLYCYWKD